MSDAYSDVYKCHIDMTMFDLEGSYRIYISLCNHNRHTRSVFNVVPRIFVRQYI